MKSRVMGAAFAVIAAVCYAPATASAADLGGDCCADLEERVAELEATTARKGNRRVSVEVYGQVNTALMYFDTEKGRGAFIVDNDNSDSRFGFRGSAKINSTLTAGFLIEVSAGIGAESNEVDEFNDDGTATGDSRLEVRHANWWLSDTRLGKLTVGRTDMTTSNLMEIDLGGINVVALSGLSIGNNLTVGGAQFDGVAGGNFEFNRNNAVRYDTPTLGGFQVGVSYGEDTRWDVALRYAGEFGGFRLAAGIGYGVDTDELVGVLVTDIDEKRVFGGSASILHVASGLFVTGVAAQRVNELNNGQEFDEIYWGLRAGISKNWFGIGNTVLYGQYDFWDNELAMANGVARAGNEATIWGAGIVQNLDAAAMELYLSYTNLSLDAPQVGTVNEDAHVVFSGARIRF